jgi:hypothetical protein
MGAAPSIGTTKGRGQIPSMSTYRMPDSADMEANPMAEAMRTKIESEMARSRMGDQLQSMGNPAAAFAAGRMGQMAERQDVGDELGGMGSLGGIGQAMAQSPEKREGRKQLRGKMKSMRERRMNRERSENL